MSLVGEDRKNYILKQLNLLGKVETSNLAAELNVSLETIRRYLEELEKKGKLTRIYGGAVKLNPEHEEPPHLQREITFIEEKKRIGKAAAQLVQDNDIIAIDEGTTTLQMAEYLFYKKNLTILTSSIPLLNLLISFRQNEYLTGSIFFIGGRVNPVHMRVAGSIAEKMMEYFHVDKAFISAEGILIKKGITSYDPDKALLTRKYVENSEETIALLDHSKIGVSKFYKIADVQEIDAVVSDAPPPEGWQEELEQKGIRWIVA